MASLRPPTPPSEPDRILTFNLARTWLINFRLGTIPSSNRCMTSGAAKTYLKVDPYFMPYNDLQLVTQATVYNALILDSGGGPGGPGGFEPVDP